MKWKDYMRLTYIALATALSLTFGTYAQAQGTCGKPCTLEFWYKVTPAEVSKAIATVGVNARDEDGATPLHFAALLGTPKNILTLLKAGADVNARAGDGATPLHMAVLFGNLETPKNILTLLKAGADVNARAGDGATPLHLAAESGIPENILALLKAGADATVKTKKGITPWNLAQKNAKLKDTKAYWALSDARFK